MKNSLSFFVFLSILVFTGCSDDNLKPAPDTDETTCNWTTAADSSSRSLVKNFWNAQSFYFNNKSSSDNSFNYWPQAHVGINLVLGVTDSPVKTHLKKINATTFAGYRFSKGWASDQRLFFAVKLSKAVENVQLFNGSKPFGGTELTAKEVSGVLNFETKAGETILVKIGISPVSEANALANIDAEVPEWNFDAVAEDAYGEWNKELSRANVESANENQLRIFYTALYHSFTAPFLFNDHNNDYRGTDKKIYQNPGFRNYTTFSLWDTYRAVHPMMEKMNAFSAKPVKFLFGGFHLPDGKYESVSEISKIARTIKSKYPSVQLFTSHCTGDRAYVVMKDILGHQLHRFYAGYSFDF